MDDSWDVAFKASPASWNKLLRRVPPAGYQSFMAMRSCDPTFSIEGNQLLVAQALPALERLVEMARQTGNEPRAQEVAAGPGLAEHAVRRNPGQITGKYVDLPGHDQKTWRIYYEEAGSEVPLILLHTAGADSRQFHDLLCDVELAENWRMLAFDLPYHGRSTPAHGWWRSPYRLTTQIYAHWCVTFIREVAKQRSVVMGSSMGGAMAIYLAARHRADVCAAIGLEAPDRFSWTPQSLSDQPASQSGLLCPYVCVWPHEPTKPGRAKASGMVVLTAREGMEYTRAISISIAGSGTRTSWSRSLTCLNVRSICLPAIMTTLRHRNPLSDWPV